MRWILVGAVAVSLLTACTDSTTSGIKGDLIWVGGGQVHSPFAFARSSTALEIWQRDRVRRERCPTGSRLLSRGTGVLPLARAGHIPVGPKQHGAFCHPRNV